MKKLRVLSLFDGISCGRVALERAGIEIDTYYASEINSRAMKISNKNYPDIIQLGDVTKLAEEELDKLGKIDMVIGGSPCQGFSIAGKQLNFNDPRSRLFFEYEKIVKYLNPTYFLLENVKMKQEYQDIISQRLGVEPIEINSSLVSAQNRKRLYWTNIPNVTAPLNKGILLKDIVHETLNDNINIEEYKVPYDKSFQIINSELKTGKIGYFRTDSQANRVYSIHGKGVTLCGDAGGGAAKMGQYLFGCLTPDRVNKRQEGQRFNDGEKFYTLTAQDKHGLLTNGYIRKLTPVECERLQTLSDDYTLTDGVSEPQRYKCLGNGWTVDVIAHLFDGLHSEGY